MKKIILLALLSLTSQAFAYKTSDILGTWNIASPELSYRASLAIINGGGAPYGVFTEQSPGNIKCIAFLAMNYSTELSTSMYCDKPGKPVNYNSAWASMMNNQKPDFTQTISLKQVAAANLQAGKFIAPTQSSLFNGQVFNFQFTRVSK